jgi:hypothetical protein
MLHICSCLFPLSLTLKNKYLSVDSIYSRVKGDATPWTRSLTAQSVLTIVADILRETVSTIGFFFPDYAPMISVLIFGCAALALRFPIALDSDESDTRVPIT